MSRLYKRIAKKCAKYAQRATGTEFNETLTMACQNCRHYENGDCTFHFLVNNK